MASFFCCYPACPSPTNALCTYAVVRPPADGKLVALSAHKRSESPSAGLENIVSGVFTQLLAKHSKSFSLIDCVSVRVDRRWRNLQPMRKQIQAWQRSELTDVTAKVVIYEAFVEGRLGGAEASCTDRTRLVFRIGARRIPESDDLEPLQCVHIGIEGVGPHSAIQSNCETRGIPGSSLCAAVLS